MKFDKNTIQTLKDDGIVILPSCINKETIDAIKYDINNFNHLTFNEKIGSLFISDNQWIDHLAIASKTALETVLNPDLLNLLDSYFNEEVVLGTFKYQKKIIGGKSIPLHRDRGPGLVMFIFLNDVNEETGSTRFIKGSHKFEVNNIYNNNINDADYINSDEYDLKNQSIGAIGEKAGTIQIYSQKILHDLPNYQKSGRETIWAIYYPISKAQYSEDHLIRNNNLIDLTENQRKRILINKKSNGVSFTSIGKNISYTKLYNISKFKIFIYIMRYFLFRLFK